MERHRIPYKEFKKYRDRPTITTFEPFNINAVIWTNRDVDRMKFLIHTIKDLKHRSMQNAKLRGKLNQKRKMYARKRQKDKLRRVKMRIKEANRDKVIINRDLRKKDSELKDLALKRRTAQLWKKRGGGNGGSGGGSRARAQKRRQLVPALTVKEMYYYPRDSYY